MNHTTDTQTKQDFLPWLANTRLFRREGGTYYLRARVPDVLRPIIGKTEIRKSLRTKALKEARRLVNIESIKVDADFAKAEKKLKGGRGAKDISRDEMVWIAPSSSWNSRRKPIRSGTPNSMISRRGNGGSTRRH